MAPPLKGTPFKAMPSKHSTKPYVSGGYYHIYNRGVEKRTIFEDEQDYGVFLSYLKTYLLPKDTKNLLENLANPEIGYRKKAEINRFLKLNNFADEIILLAYCLMPNHFHFLVKQDSSESIDGFMNSLGTRYTMYFNRRYQRVGPLYQGVYKAILIKKEEHFLHLSRYIHKQALTSKGDALQSQPSSYPDYLRLRSTAWVHSEEILGYFSDRHRFLSYQSFVESDEDFAQISKLTIDNF